MLVIPELNLNKHPKDVKNGSLVNAVNMQIAKDSFLLTNENSIIADRELQNEISDAIGISYENFNIVYAIPCNKEIVFFIQDKNNTKELILTRYDEDRKAAIKGPTIDYAGGDFDGTFTYNQGELIITFSEFNSDIKQPLKTINLKDFNNTPNLPKYIHSCVPEVKIPSIENKYINGSAKKGWYYIFIRYKISTNNYTQWYYTNKSVFIDSYNEKYVLDYYYDTTELANNNRIGGNSNIAFNISDDTDISDKSAILQISNIDTRYEYYQLGFVIVNKTNNYGCITDDIKNDYTQFIINNKILHEHAVSNIITNYFNYFNVKTLSTYNNVLYIANYEEKNEEHRIIDELVNINLTITALTESSRAGLPSEDYSVKPCRFKYTPKIENANQGNVRPNDKIIDGYYSNLYGYCIPLTTCAVNPLYHDDIEKWDITPMTLNPLDKITITDGNTTLEQYQVKNFYYCPNYNNTGHSAWIMDPNIGEYGVILTVFDNSSSPVKITSINGVATDYTLIDFDYKPVDVIIVDDTNVVTDGTSYQVLSSNTFGNNEYYNFYIHFVNKYGNVTDGFNIKEFNIIYGTDSAINKDSELYNKLGCLLLKTPSDDVEITFKLNKLPIGYVGYFITYEKFESYIKHKGFVVKEKVNDFDKYVVKFYSTELDVVDAISLSFNKIKILGGVNISTNTTDTIIAPNTLDPIANPIRDIVSKKLLVADSYENYARATNIELNIDDTGIETNNTTGNTVTGFYCYYAYLYDSDIENKLYNNNNKTLIPCSNIQYNIENNTIVAPKTHFVSSVNSIINYNLSVYNDSKFKFYKILNYYIRWIKSKEDFSDLGKFLEIPYYHISYKDKLTIPTESYTFNNRPRIIVFPIMPITADAKENLFATGCITEIKDTIDLFNQPQVPEFALHPKTYTEYREEKQYTTIFNKTIRRSNPIQDESYNLAWRFFNTDNYKNIIENKGDIIKLTTLGNTMLIHTQHSMFQFNADATLALNENADKVNIENIDIWNLQYKEVYTSKLGFAGLQKLEHAIQGQFGYIFYDADGKRFFRYDGGKLKQIDANVNNYVRNLPNDIDINLILDEYRNRILINFNNNNFINSLSYNYIYDIFVSKHESLYNKGYSTKNNLYLVTNNDDTKLYRFDNNNYNDYKFSNTSEASILFNTEYDKVKIIEYITYKINKILNINNLDNYSVDSYYSGDKIQIYNNECDTKLLDIYIENPKKTINRTKDYTKPYRDLGVWNFSPIRDDMKGYINITNNSNTMTRIYGNYFIIRFVFNNITVNNKCIELENVNVDLNNSIL